MRIIFIVFFLITSFKAIAQQQLPPLGHWREHLPYNSAIDIADGTDKVYCATPFSIFSVNKENEKERYSRITGLMKQVLAPLLLIKTNRNCLLLIVTVILISFIEMTFLIFPT